MHRFKTPETEAEAVSTLNKNEISDKLEESG